MLKNKRGDIPVMILVFGVFAICGLAILSFIIFDTKTFKGDGELSVGVLEELNSNIEKFYFYKNAGFSNGEAAEKIDGAVIENGKLVIKKSNDAISVIYTKSL